MRDCTYQSFRAAAARSLLRHHKAYQRHISCRTSTPTTLSSKTETYLSVSTTIPESSDSAPAADTADRRVTHSRALPHTSPAPTAQKPTRYKRWHSTH